MKRVLGLPGDVVRRDVRMVRRGSKAGRRLGFGSVPEEVIVPPGQVFVEGDNWRDSLDSNDFGTLPMALVTGRAVRKGSGLWDLLMRPQLINTRGKGCSWTRVEPGKDVCVDDWEEMMGWCEGIE